MTVRRTPNMRLEVSAYGTALQVSDAQGNKLPPIACRLSEREVGEYARALTQTLEQIRGLLRGPHGTNATSAANRALALLNQRGLTLLFQIFGDDCHRLAQIFRDCCPAWQSESEPAIVTVATRLGHFLPVEFLPLFELTEWPKHVEGPELLAAARRFPGFATIVRRELTTIPVNHDLVFDNAPVLAVKCFYDRDLPGASHEVDFFRANAAAIEMEGPWPESTLEEFPGTLAHHVRFANTRFDGRARADHIQHFVCHCDIDTSVSQNSRLRFSQKNEATIGDLLARFVTLGVRSRERENGPLVFLNACGTSRVEPFAVTSFPRFFLEQNGNRGFIGTEATMPDEFAAAFARAFYRTLLTGVGLGRAIHDAKWEMLRTLQSPLGIFYVAYADPDLRVRLPVPLKG
jgi:hypothetical protein